MDYTTIISASELAGLADHDDVRIFDCRFFLKDPQGGVKKYQEGHIPNAQFADMDTQLSSPMTETSGRHPLPDQEKFVEQLRAWGISNSTQVIAYDDMSGAFAARMWWLLRWMGHDKVAVLDGGMQQWEAQGLAFTTEEPQFDTGNFVAQPRHEWLVDIDSVQTELAAGNITLIDARAADRYTGKDQKTDPVPGHVPGAQSLPFPGNLTQQGTFAQPEVINARFSQLIGDQSLDKIVNMCGSGVTACHNLLALEIAGITPTKLFVGSWSQWIRDPSRPVALGENP